MTPAEVTLSTKLLKAFGNELDSLSSKCGVTDRFDQKLNGLDETARLEKFQAIRQVDEQREQVRLLAKIIVHQCIDEISTTLDLGSAHRSYYPYVEVVDPMLFSQRDNECAINGLMADEYFSSSTSYFSPFGGMYIGQPAQPVISLFLPNLSEEAILEESIHYLLDFHETTRIQGAVVTAPILPEWRRQRIAGITECATPDSKVIQVKLNSWTDSDCFFHGILTEAVAECLRTKLGFKSLAGPGDAYQRLEALSQIEITGIPSGELPRLIRTLVENGTDQFLATLYSFHDGVDSLKDLNMRYPFAGPLKRFPHELQHAIGYHIGAAIAERLETPESLGKFGRKVFRSNLAPQQKLEGILR